VYYRTAAFRNEYLWQNDEDINKEIYPVYSGKCLSHKAVHNWVEKLSDGCSKVADDARPGAKVAETTVKRLLCRGFRRTGKAMGHVYQCWWRIYREINVFASFEYHIFYVLHPFVTYILSLPRTIREIFTKVVGKCRFSPLTHNEDN
jgi:hypothetical protein